MAAPETRLKTFYLGDEQFPLEPYYTAYQPVRRLTSVPVTIQSRELGAGIENVIRARVQAMNGTCTNNEFLHQILGVRSKYNTRIGNTMLGVYGLEYNVTIEAMCGDVRAGTVLFGCDHVSAEPKGIKLNYQKCISIIIPQDLVPEGFVCPNKINVRVTGSFLEYGGNGMCAMGKIYYYPKYGPQVRLVQMMPGAPRETLMEFVFRSTDVRPQYRDLLAESLTEAGPDMLELYESLCNATSDSDPKERTLEELAARLGIQTGSTVMVLAEIERIDEALLRRASEARCVVYDGEDHNEELFSTLLCVAAGPQTCAIRINNLQNPATIDLVTILGMKYGVIGIYTPLFGNHFDGSAYLIATGLRADVPSTAARASLRDAFETFGGGKKGKKYWMTAFHERHRPAEEFHVMALERHQKIVDSYVDVARSLHETYGADIKKPGLEHIIQSYQAAQIELKHMSPPIIH